ncbi:putative FAD binding protein [Podospora fimiseda]|uniref:FAD binding protein n=1 Tax=Podospora fimiseda TaxID=252190 RepID=A0AAN7BUC7_9PEZI|nr:putative FAD binding protein [Podospora fimiseda]
MGRTVVILGASYASLPVAHYLLKYTSTKIEGLKVIIVAPNTHLFWAVASIRAIVPDLFDDGKVSLPLAPAFTQYPSDKYELVHGKATNVNPSANTVDILLNDENSSRTIQYDDLIIATGSSIKHSMPFKTLSTTPETLASLHDWSSRIKSAQSIIIAGAGMTGVELAGELGQEYSLKNLKEITLICDDTLPFSSRFNDAFRKTAKRELERLGVKVMTQTKLVSLPTQNTKTVSLMPTTTKGEKTYTVQADLVIPTFGIVPNTEFLPKSWLDTNGFIKQSPKGLKVEGTKNVYVLGDAGNLEAPTAKNADTQAVWFAKAFEKRLLGGEEEEEYKPDPMVVAAVSIGRNKGAGQAGGWKIWGWIIWYMKARYLGTDYAEAYVRGERTVLVKKW